MINNESLEAKIQQKLEGVKMDFGEIPPFPEALKTKHKNYSHVIWLTIAASISIVVLLVLHPKNESPTQKTETLMANSLDYMNNSENILNLSEKSSVPLITLAIENQRKNCAEKEECEISIIDSIIDNTSNKFSPQHTDTICDIGNDISTTAKTTDFLLASETSKKKVQSEFKGSGNSKYFGTSLYGSTLASNLLTFEGSPYNPNGHLMDEEDSNNVKEKATIMEVPVINLGASVDYPLTTKWHMALGIYYSWNKYLIQLEHGEKNKYQLDLHSIGVPINAKYSLFETNRWITYSQIGLEIRIPLSTVFKDLKIDHSDITFNSKTNMSISTSTSVGVEYRLSKTAGIYIDGGVRYDLIPIKSDFPANIQLPRWHTQFNLGVRFRVANF